MKQTFMLALACVATIILVGCGTTSPMMTMGTRKMQPAAGKAQVTFIRPTRYGGGINFTVWDGARCLGAVNAKKYMQADVDPGKHVFVCHGRGWNFIKADLEAGKKYFCLITLRPGMFSPKANFQPIARRVTKPAKIEQWLAELTCRTTKPDQVAAYEERRKVHFERMVSKVEAGEVKSFELKPEDGF